MDAMISTNRLSVDEGVGSPSSRPRIAWIDYARGLSILMVVVGHVALALAPMGLLGDGPLLRIWDARYYNIRMPLFFVLSGLFAERWTSRRTVDFLHDKGATIVYPFLVWGTLQTLVRVAMDPLTHANTTLWDVVVQPINPDWQFWFLYVLFFLMLGYFLLRKLGMSPTACLAVALACHALQKDGAQGSLVAIDRALYYAPFYAVGGLAGTWASRIRIQRPSHLGAVVAFGFGAMVGPAFFSDDPPLAIQLIASLCGVAGAIALTSLLSRARFMGFLTVLGRHSLEILVAHMLIISALRIGLHRGLRVENGMAHLILGSVAGVVGPLLLVWFCNRLHLRYAFRLPRPAKPARVDSSQSAPKPGLAMARAPG